MKAFSKEHMEAIGKHGDSRYIIMCGSDLGHCCIEYTIIDTKKHDKHNYFDMVCECTSKEHADRICKMLNLADSKM